MVTKKDERDCPKCHTRMEYKVSFTGFNEGGDWCLYQCPKCKNVEILWEESQEGKLNGSAQTDERGYGKTPTATSQ